jgi:hypothetical protein
MGSLENAGRYLWLGSLPVIVLTGLPDSPLVGVSKAGPDDIPQALAQEPARVFDWC